MSEAGKTSQICNPPAKHTQQRRLANGSAGSLQLGQDCKSVAVHVWQHALSVGVEYLMTCTHVLSYTRQGSMLGGMCAAVLPVCKLATEADVQMYQRIQVG